MKIIFSIILLLLSLPILAQPNPQSKKITEAFFPDIEFEIHTPAFQKKKDFTNYEEMMAFLTPLVEANKEEVTLSFIGQSQKGKEIPMIQMKRDGAAATKVKVWIQAGMHGNEPASTEGILYLIEKLLTDSAYNYLLDRLEIAIVPMVNIDGYEKQDRYAANGLDLNRDQTKLMVQESIHLKKAFSAFGAEVAMDFHEYRPYRKDFAQLSTYGITSIFDAMFLYSGNLNVPENLRNFTKEAFVNPAKEAMDAHELRHHDYVSTTRFMGDILFNQGSVNARSSATSFALTNAISCLFEVRGVGIGRTSFKRRVFTTFLLATSFMESAYGKVEEIKKEIAVAKAYTAEAVVKSKRNVSKQPLQTIDIDTRKEISLPVTIRDAWKSTASLTRSRPVAYVILSTETAVIEKLKILGLEMETFSAEKNIEVESYTVTEYQQSPEKYEGVFQQEVSTEIQTLEKTFPPGTHILYLDQAKANLAIEVLEPEAPNSFVSFSVIETEAGAELPIFRYHQTNKP